MGERQEVIDRRLHVEARQNKTQREKTAARKAEEGDGEARNDEACGRQRTPQISLPRHHAPVHIYIDVYAQEDVKAGVSSSQASEEKHERHRIV